jgi:hypothetical protein
VLMEGITTPETGPGVTPRKGNGNTHGSMPLGDLFSVVQAICVSCIVNGNIHLLTASGGTPCGSDLLFSGRQLFVVVCDSAININGEYNQQCQELCSNWCTFYHLQPWLDAPGSSYVPDLQATWNNCGNCSLPVGDASCAQATSCSCDNVG